MDRRTFLKFLASTAAALALPVPAIAKEVVEAITLEEPDDPHGVTLYLNGKKIHGLQRISMENRRISDIEITDTQLEISSSDLLPMAKLIGDSNILIYFDLPYDCTEKLTFLEKLVVERQLLNTQLRFGRLVHYGNPRGIKFEFQSYLRSYEWSFVENEDYRTCQCELTVCSGIFTSDN